MSMQEWPDDHLDDLFRKSTEEFDAPFDPAHWADMNNRLDENDRQGFYDRWRVWGGAAALTGLLLITLWWAWKVTTVVTNPVVERADNQIVELKATANDSPKTELITVTSAPNNNATKPNAIAPHPTDSRPTPDRVKQPVATPDWAARSRETVGQWRRRAATSRPAKTVVKHSSIATGQPDADINAADQPRINRLVKSRLATEKSTRLPSGQAGSVPARGHRQSAKKQQINGLPDDENELVTTLNRPDLSATKQIDEKQRLVAQGVANRGRTGQPVPTRVVAETSASTEKTTANGYQSDRSPEPISSTNAPTKRSGGFSDQPQPTKPPSTQNAQFVDPGTTVTKQPTEAPVVDRLQLSMASPVSSLTAVKRSASSTLEEPYWDDVDRPAQRVFMPMQRLSIMAVYSPDFSAIGLRDFTKPGANAGLMIQYRLSERFSLQTGAMYSSKKYQTESEYYVFPWTWTPQPNSIAGTCTMIDIPLNLRYDWLRRPMGDGMPPARWFGSAGLTSYFIQHENYVYTYEDPTNPLIGNRTGWDNIRAGKPGGKFGFSNLNLSVGYERPLSRHLSWQVEPFMKIPLQQVGNFKVRLLSTGAFIGLKYSL